MLYSFFFSVFLSKIGHGDHSIKNKPTVVQALEKVTVNHIACTDTTTIVAYTKDGMVWLIFFVCSFFLLIKRIQAKSLFVGLAPTRLVFYPSTKKIPRFPFPPKSTSLPRLLMSLSDKYLAVKLLL